MHVKLDGNRARTISPYDVRVLKALNRLEGMKRWGANRSLSFEATPYNFEVWRSVFPEAEIEGLENSPAAPAAPAAVSEDRLFDIGGSRGTYEHKNPPRAHQKAALEKIGRKVAAGLFMEVGTGKSWTAITLMGQRWCAGLIDRVVLVAPNNVDQQWVLEQLPAHMSKVVPYKAWKFKKGTKAALAQKEALFKFSGLRILVINFESISKAETQSVIFDFLRGAEKTSMVVVDESHRIKNSSSKVTEAAFKIAALCRFRLIMSGTPLTRDLVDKYSQFKFLDERIIGHRYITTFKNQYCNYMETDFGPKLVGHKNLEQFYARIEPYVYRITTAEAYDLPPKNYVEKRFDLSPEQLRIMQELKDQFFTEVGDDEFLFVKNAASLLTRLQQVGCGFLPRDDGSFLTLPNPRLEELQRIIDQRSGKIIVWCRFQQDVELVAGVYGSRAVKYYGPTKPADRTAALKAFMDAGSGTDIFVASPGAAGTGLNLQGLCQTNIYYSNSYNAIDRWQSEGRTWRDGTTLPVTYFDLIARKSPDQKIITNLKNKRDLSDLVLDELRALFGLEKET